MERAQTDDRVPRWGAVSAVAAPVLLIGGWTVAAGLQRDGFDAVSGTISALSAHGADHRWVMTLALAGVGVAHLTTAAALRPAALPGRLLLALGGAATLGVAAAPLPAGGGGSVAHTVTAAVAFASLASWPALASPVEREGRSGKGAVWTGPTGIAPPDPPADPFRRRTGLVVAAVLIGEVAWFTAELVTGGPRIGLLERVAAGSQALWPLAAVLLARRRMTGGSGAPA